jgi:hypothetical protein
MVKKWLALCASIKSLIRSGLIVFSKKMCKKSFVVCDFLCNFAAEKKIEHYVSFENEGIAGGCGSPVVCQERI